MPDEAQILMGIEPSGWQLYFTAAVAIGVVNSVVGGAAVALAVGRAFGTSLGVAVAVGAVAALIVLFLALRYQTKQRGAGTRHPILFPTAPAA
jgi:uncharacterized membrane protein YdjX (TVP38/TMEM64 family)